MNMERTRRGVTFLQSLRFAGAGWFCAAAILTILSQLAWGQGYQVIQVNPSGAKAGTTHALGVNKGHSVVGEYVAKSSGSTVGFLYSAGKYTEINPPTAYGFARANGINDSGTIVGDFLTSDNRYHGFIYSGETYTTYDENTTESCGIFGVNSVGDFGGDVGDGPVRGFVNIGGKKSEFYAKGTESTYVYGLNVGGEAVGNYYDSSNVPHGFHRSSTGTITLISYPGAASTMVTGINDAGVITGSYTTSSGQSHGFTDTKGTFVTTDFLGTYGIASDASYVGVYVGVDGVQSGYLATPHTLTLTKGTIANSTQGDFWGINNAGAVVGTYTDLKGTSHGMMISGGVVANIDDPKGPTLCRAINSSNQIVGDYFDISGNPHGFLYSDGTFTDIPGPTNAVSSEATGINDAGVISGDYWDTVTKTYHGFILKSGTYKTLDPPGTISTLGGGINANDDVTLWWHDKANYRQSSLYNGTTYISINVPGATNSLAYGVNKTNQVVFVWTDSYLAKHGAVKEGAAYYIFDFPKGNTTGATGINDSGEFVGSYIPAGKTTDQPLEGK